MRVGGLDDLPRMCRPTLFRCITCVGLAARSFLVTGAMVYHLGSLPTMGKLLINIVAEFIESLMR